MSEIAFDGATAYALEWDKDDTVPLRIVRFSLLRPELREVMATLPKEAKELYPLLLPTAEICTTCPPVRIACGISAVTVTSR